LKLVEMGVIEFRSGPFNVIVVKVVQKIRGIRRAEMVMEEEQASVVKTTELSNEGAKLMQPSE